MQAIVKLLGYRDVDHSQIIVGDAVKLLWGYISPGFRTSDHKSHSMTRRGVLEGQVLGVEVSSPRNLSCPRLEDSTIFLNRKNVVGKRQKPRGKFAKPFFVFLFRRSLKKIFCRPFFFFFCGNRMKNFIEDLFFLANTCACVFGPWIWPRAFLSSASRGSVLGRAVLFFCDFFVSLASSVCRMENQSRGLVYHATMVLLKGEDLNQKLKSENV